MKRYTTYDSDTSTALVTGQAYPHVDGVTRPSGMPDNLYLLEEIRADRATYDPATHRLVKDAIVYDVTNLQAVQAWSVVALTQAEIDANTPEHYETSTGIKMATDLQSQAAFSNMMTLLNEAGYPDTEMVMIKDCFGASHGMTLADFKTHAVAFGLHCYSQFHSS
jgi:hypothetical protein